MLSTAVCLCSGGSEGVLIFVHSLRPSIVTHPFTDPPPFSRRPRWFRYTDADGIASTYVAEFSFAVPAVFVIDAPVVTVTSDTGLEVIVVGRSAVFGDDGSTWGIQYSLRSITRWPYALEALSVTSPIPGDGGAATEVIEVPGPDCGSALGSACLQSFELFVNAGSTLCAADFDLIETRATFSCRDGGGLACVSTATEDILITDVDGADTCAVGFYSERDAITAAAITSLSPAFGAEESRFYHGETIYLRVSVDSTGFQVTSVEVDNRTCRE